MSAVHNLIINGTGIVNTVSGGIGIAGNMHIGGNNSVSGSVSGTVLATNNQAYFADGLNQGYIQQLSTELTLGSSGNKIALAPNNALVFDNSSVSQLSAYSERHTINPIEFHGMNGWDVVKQTLSLQNLNIITTFAVGGGNIYSYCLGTLFKGSVIRGIFTWVNTTLTNGCHFGLYKARTQALVASTASNIGTDISGFVYFNLSSSYTVDETTVYYVSALSVSAVNSLSITHSRYNYDLATSISSLSRRTQYTNSTYTSLPSSLSGVASTSSNNNVFIGVYENFLLNTDPTLLTYTPYDNTISGKELWNYNRYFIDGSTTNNVTITTEPTIPGSYNINAGSRIGNTCLNFRGRIQFLNTINPTGSFNRDNFTVSLWVKSENYSNNNRFFTLTPTGGGFMVLQHYSGIIYCNCDNTYLMDNSNSSINITVNTWGHVAIVIDGPTMTYYVNGALLIARTRVSTYGSPTSVVNSYVVGFAATNMSSSSIDYVDDVRVYNRSLNIDEIRELYTYRGSVII